jgi:23S rRNA pseudouridine2605 synthase
MPEERVQKILARAGYGSRRASEELIIAGRVKINGKTAVLGSKADPQRDTITIDNQPITKEQAPVYIAVNKPQGILSEVSPEEPRETVRDLVPVPGHMFIVGRLDLESEGLILLTNDGELANKLSHPRYGHEKEYHVVVGARPDDRQLEAWRHGVVLEDGYRTVPAQVRVDGLAGNGAWLQVILREGRKRQIREMGKLTGLPVLRIIRVRIGSLLLGDLKPGGWRELRQDEIRALKVNKTYREVGPETKARYKLRSANPDNRESERSEGRRGPSHGPRVAPSNTDSQTPFRKPSRPPRGRVQEGRAQEGSRHEGAGREGTQREVPRKPARAPSRPSSRTPSGGPSHAPRGGSSRPASGAPRRTPRRRSDS